MSTKEGEPANGGDESRTDYKFDSRIGETMERAIRRLAGGDVYPSMHQLAISIGPHGSAKFGYESIHRCRKRDLVALDPDHPEAELNGRGAVVLTDKGRAYADLLDGDSR